MSKHNTGARMFPSEHRSPFTDLTNTSTFGSENQEPQQNSSQTAYAQISDEKESTSLLMHRVNLQQKIPSGGDIVTHDPVAHTHASSLGSAQCIAFSNITNTHTDGCTSTSSASHHLKEVNGGRKIRSGTSWYASLSNEQRAEYLNKQRIARLKRKHASSKDNVDVTQNSSFSIGATSTTPTSTSEQEVTIQKQRRSQSWYARLSDERRAEYQHKQRMARVNKKAATTVVTVPQSSSPQATTAETSMPDNYAITEHELPDIVGDCNKRSGKGWYASLSVERKEEHLRKLRISHKQKRTAALDVDLNEGIVQSGSAQSELTRVLDTPLCMPNLDDGGSGDWLHSNPTYVRQPRSTEPIVPMSFIIGHSTEPIDASNDKECHRKKTKYSEMSTQQKDALLDRNHAYKRGKRKCNHTDVPSGSSYPSSHTPATEVRPLYKNSHTGGINNEDDDNPIGVFEPMVPDAHMEEFLDTVRNFDTLPDDDDEECRLFSVQGNEFESYRVTPNGSHAFEADDPYDYVYKNLPTKHHVLKLVKDCVHCGAMRFQYEGPAFCCRKGKVKVFIPEVPQELQRLFTSQVDKDAKYFRKHIRYFNSHFSFTSLGVTLDQRVNTAARTGIYTFRAHGQLYHRLDHLVPDDHGPRHLQLYIYDTDEALEHRVKRSPDLDVNLIRKILSILENNPYVETFKSLGSVPDLGEYKITLNTNITLDQRRYNASTASQVAAMWVEGGEIGWNRWLPYEGPTPAQVGNEDDDENQDDDQEADDNDEQDEDEPPSLENMSVRGSITVTSCRSEKEFLTSYRSGGVFSNSGLLTYTSKWRL